MITIGVSTYKDHVMTEKLISSIIKRTDGQHGKDYQILVVDDGTPDNNIFEKLQEVCNKYGVRLLKNERNRGIPYVWNRIVSESGSDIVIIFNNDIIVTDPNWLKHFEYVLTKNEKIGSVGFPLINPPHFAIVTGIDGDTVSWNSKIEPFWGSTPGRCGAVVGCCFGFKKEVWQQVKNPDGSIGFWEDLVSFYEETHFGFKLCEMGYYNIMLNWPPMVHLGSQTFRKYCELRDRSVDWSKRDRENRGEFINTMITFYPRSWKKNWKKTGDVDGVNVEMVNRAAFSRYMFAKYWNALDSYNAPQIPVHKRIVDPMPKREIKWLDKDLKERVDEI